MKGDFRRKIKVTKVKAVGRCWFWYHYPNSITCYPITALPTPLNMVQGQNNTTIAESMYCSASTPVVPYKVFGCTVSGMQVRGIEGRAEEYSFTTKTSQSACSCHISPLILSHSGQSVGYRDVGGILEENRPEE